MRKDPKSVKKTDSLTVFFELLGSAHVKASHKMLVKSTQGGKERCQISIIFISMILASQQLEREFADQEEERKRRTLFNLDTNRY